MMDITSNLRFRVKTANETFEAIIDNFHKEGDDDIGALYYVVAVVLIYGLSIVMMIASHIRKNKQDSQLRSYLKEMSVLRKNDRREKLYSRVATMPQSIIKPLLPNTAPNDAKHAGYTALPTQETDEESQNSTKGSSDMPKSSTSDGTNDSVFQYEEIQDASLNFDLLKNNTRTNVHTQVIDEHVSL